MWNPICKDIDITQSTMEDTKRFQEQAYQRKLDNVLSRFKKGSGNFLYYGLVLVYSLYDKKFRVTGANNSLSLETVESLLKDLEQ